MKRIAIVGTSCSGKSSLAARLSAALRVPHVELDALYWEPNWRSVDTTVFHERVQTVLDADTWIVDGNDNSVRDAVIASADTVIWLDYSFPTVLWRSISRTWRRLVNGERCCNGNRETLRLTLSRDPIVWWVVKTYRQRRREYNELLPAFAKSGRAVLIFRRPIDTEGWLGSIEITSNSFFNGTACETDRKNSEAAH